MKQVIRLARFSPHQKYFLKDGTQVTGASTIAKLGDSPDPLIKWAYNLGREGKSLDEARAAEPGTISHFLIDRHLKGESADLCEFAPEEIDKGENSFIKGLEFLDREELDPVAIERQLVSEKYRYGGTLDLVMRDKIGQLVLIDWKGSKDYRTSHYRQISGYRMLWDENYNEKISRMAIVLIGRTEDGTCRPRWIRDSTHEKNSRIFIAQAHLYNTISNKL